MGFQVPITIETALRRIQDHDFVLPAIQREFVWSPAQVERLFDSLMRGYPIGSFLFWRVAAAESRDFVFYDFIRNYHQLNAPHCPRLDLPATKPVTAILDGQQRLTALNVGLRGSHAQKLPRKWWSSLDAYPVRLLHLNLIGPAKDNDQGMEYDFRFLTEAEARDRSQGGSEHWFQVRKVLEFNDATDIFAYVQDCGLAELKPPFKYLARLHQLAKGELVVNYFEEEDQDLDKVLNIFIRVNSAGTILSYSDLLLSIATAQWTERDAREAVFGLVDELNAPPQDFAFSKDLVLKAGLVVADVGDVRFKVMNFTKSNMAKLESQWDAISTSIRLAARLLSDFGFSDRTLSADSVIIPISYYLSRRGATDTYLSSVAHEGDRKAIRDWVIRSMVKPGIWGSGLDTLLTALRDVIREAEPASFPVDALERRMASLGKSLVFQEDEIEDLVETPYGNRRVFPLLSLLYPAVNVRLQFHEDHVFPSSRFTKKRLVTAGVPEDRVEEFMSKVNGLPNLQLLEGPVNVQKQAMMPLDWVNERFPEEAREGFLAMHDMTGLPAEMSAFVEFYEARRARLAARLRKLLGVEPGQ